MAQAMIEWAMTKGVTHYTHWFHPLTGASAEKHDAFFKPSLNLEHAGIESLSASELVQREPDGSSFPSGGLRATHEARSYTIWDPSSPAFILETANGKTLYVPAVFISYTGESLDYKTPLLKANTALNVAATRVCQYFDEAVTHVFSTLGWEQEYFLVDEQFVNARPDLLLAGRTVFGGKSAKGQQMDDHYFGSIPVRVEEFMKEFELEALKLGIPIITRHNEVAPGQYECAPMFEETNVAIDHNLLVMDIMQKIAIKHRFWILFGEKPFAGLNGSGKHSNWSLANSHGDVLLFAREEPGRKLAISDVLHQRHQGRQRPRGTASSEHCECGERPPTGGQRGAAGHHLDLHRHAARARSRDVQGRRGGSGGAPAKDVIDLKLTKIPAIPKDQTDRNRTSPFAFTGNRFEFRAVGASANCAAPMTVLNTIVAHQLVAFSAEVDSRIQTNPNTDEVIVEVLQGYMADVERIVFNGNGYSQEWEDEAAARGLSNNKTTPDALTAMISDDARDVFGAQDVLSERELRSRYEVLLENYTTGRDRGRPARGVEHDPRVTRRLRCDQPAERDPPKPRRGGTPAEAQSVVSQVGAVAEQTTNLTNGLAELKEARSAADATGDTAAIARAYCDRVKPLFDVDVRASTCSKDSWTTSCGPAEVSRVAVPSR